MRATGRACQPANQSEETIFISGEQRSTGAQKQPIAVWRTKFMCYDEPTIQGQLDEIKGKLKHYDFALELSAAGLHIAI
jgi:hypothetical protein